MRWKGRSININGEYLSHLRFADNIGIVAETVKDLQYLLNGLTGSTRNGLQMNLIKTKLTFIKHVLLEPVAVNGVTLEVVQEHIYLTQTFQLGRNHFEKETRQEFGWAGLCIENFVKYFRHPYRKVLKQKSSQYGAETWTLPVRLVHQFQVA